MSKAISNSTESNVHLAQPSKNGKITGWLTANAHRNSLYKFKFSHQHHGKKYFSIHRDQIPLDGAMPFQNSELVFE